jgi:hypothetical protein
LEYFAPGKRDKILGRIIIGEVNEITQNGAQIELQTSTSKLLLRADSENEAAAWFAALSGQIAQTRKRMPPIATRSRSTKRSSRRGSNKNYYPN